MTTKHLRLAVLAALAVAMTACYPQHVSAGSSDATSPEPVASTPPAGSPSPAATPSSSPTPGPTRVADPVDCQPKDLDPRPYYSTGGGAMGSVGWYVTVQNSARAACRLAQPPVLYDSGSRIRQDGAPTGQPPVVLAPGRYASFLVLTHIGETGYGSDDPACQHPAHYRNLSVALAGGKRFPLPGFTIGFQCEQAHVGPWGETDGAPLPNPTRAP